MSPEESQDPEGLPQQPPAPQADTTAPTPVKSRGLLIGIAIGVVVAAGGFGAAAVLGHSTSASSSVSAVSGSAGPSANAASLPPHADGLLLLTSANAQQEVSRVRTAVSIGGLMYANALIGAYGPQAKGGYRLVLVDQPISNLPSNDQSQFDSYAPSTFLKAIVEGTHMSDAQTEKSSDSSAALICGTITADGVTVPTCVWDDSTTFGLAYFYTTYFTTGFSDAAQYTDALRSAAEAGRPTAD